MALKRTRSDFESPPSPSSIYTSTTYSHETQKQSAPRKRFYEGPSVFQHAFFAAQPPPSQFCLPAPLPCFPPAAHSHSQGTARGASLPTSFSRSRQSSPASTTSSGCNTPTATHEVPFFSCEECAGDMMEVDDDMKPDGEMEGGRGCEGCSKVVCGSCLEGSRCGGCRREKEKPSLIRRGPFLASGFRRDWDV